MHMAHYAHLTRVCKSAIIRLAHFVHTFVLVCKVCTMFQTLSGKSSKNT